jgi:hypothetical protein
MLLHVLEKKEILVAVVLVDDTRLASIETTTYDKLTMCFDRKIKSFGDGSPTGHTHNDTTKKRNHECLSNPIRLDTNKININPTGRAKTESKCRFFT